MHTNQNPSLGVGTGWFEERAGFGVKSLATNLATKPNAIEVPSIALPKGGGAIKGIDEKFSVNAINGTASFSISLPFAPARGTSPSLSLTYNSGAGNSIFG